MEEAAMLKESEQTDGQKLLKQLREEYKRPERPSPKQSLIDAEACDTELWSVETGSIN